MRKKIAVLLMFCLCASLLTACTGGAGTNQLPTIAPMALTDAQQEIVTLLTNPNQEILLFEYTDGVFISIEIWVEIYRYGELIDQRGGLQTLSDAPIEARPIAITITRPGSNEFQWTISIGGATQQGTPWTAEHAYMARAFGPIQEPIEIIDDQEIILYMSRFTTGNVLGTMGDLQWYLENPEALAEFTYTHIIKARLTK
ncbi:MAG: hypothetical protein FWE12_05690 [Oscillospiraceae bacterium]|nr:hypothetical protein [Oscillospiraceae bacterium]